MAYDDEGNYIYDETGSDAGQPTPYFPPVDYGGDQTGFVPGGTYDGGGGDAGGGSYPGFTDSTDVSATDPGGGGGGMQPWGGPDDPGMPGGSGTVPGAEPDATTPVTPGKPAAPSLAKRIMDFLKTQSTPGKLAPILGGAADRAQKAQSQQNTDNILRDRTAIDRYTAGLKAPGTRLGTSVGASRVANFQPVKASWGGPGSGMRGESVHFTGGAQNPDLMSPDTTALANEITHQELLDSMAPGHGGPPAATPPAQSSAMDKILGGGSFASSLLGAYETENNADPVIRRGGKVVPPKVGA